MCPECNDTRVLTLTTENYGTHTVPCPYCDEDAE